MGEKNNNVGSNFVINNLRNLTSQYTTTVTQVPLTLNNPPPGVLREKDIPAGSWVGKVPAAVAPAAAVVEEFSEQFGTAWEAAPQAAPTFASPDNSLTESFDSNWDGVP